MARLRFVLLVAAAGVGVLTCSAPPAPSTPAMTITPRPRTIDDEGMVAAIQVTVADAEGAPKKGTVTLTAAAGVFTGAGLTTTFDLDGAGKGTANWSCELAIDARCTGDVRLEARWESGADFLVQVVRVTVGPPDAGASGSADGGGGIPLSASKVYLLGTLLEGACYMDGLADPAMPTQVAIGFSCTATSLKLSGSSLLYLDSSTGGPVLRFVADAPVKQTPTSPWTYPFIPRLNDVVVPTPGCTDVLSFFPGPGGALLYQCAAGDWSIDGQPVTVPPSFKPVALGAGGLLLLTNDAYFALPAADGGLTPLSFPDGGTVPVAALETPARSNPQGFWLVSSAMPRSRYLVRADATVERQGQFAGYPAGFAGSQQVLDGTGNLVVMGTVGGTVGAIAELPLLPGAPSIKYTEASATPNDWSKTPPKLYIKIDSSALVTGP